VVLAARGKEVVIRSGQFARLNNGVPTTPEPIPQSLFLKVEWPAPQNSKRAVTVAGHTAPNARVKVAGHYVRVEPDGSYRSKVALPDGSHELSVRATDVAGHVVDEKSPRIVIDTATDFKAHTPKWK
jgi:hypothetical protein